MLTFGNQCLEKRLLAGALALAGVAALPAAGLAQVPETGLQRYSYADLASLTEAADVVVKAEIRDQATVEPERSPGLLPGQVRIYVEARTLALLSGSGALGEDLRYLVDLPADAKGKPPKLKGHEVYLFARTVPARPGELQLLASSAQVPLAALDETRLRGVLRDFAAPDQPPKISGIRDALSVAGNLAGESETQIFLEAERDRPASITVIRRPGMSPAWGISWSEILDQAARPPEPDTVAWYRLACFLPDSLPASASLTRDRAAFQRAAQDYDFVRQSLGGCERHLSDWPR